MATDGRPTMIDGFAAACRTDTRVVAAFLGGSHAAGTADEHSDLDLYVIVKDEAYEDFFAERHSFLHPLGSPIFLEDFDEFGWDMLVFIFSNGVEGGLAIARESRFEHIHGGPFEVLVDREGMLAQRVFPLYRMTESEQKDTLRWLMHWFWHDLSKFGTAMARGRLWSAYSHLEALRLKCVNLARLKHDPIRPPEGYKGLGQNVDSQDLSSLRVAFCPIERDAILEVVRGLIELYLRIAPLLARKHGIDYPTSLQKVIIGRLKRQCGVSLSTQVIGQTDKRG